MNRYADLEEKIKRTGQAIYDSVSGEVPSLFDRRRWTGRIMDRVMKDEAFKVSLFRFIDLMPVLKSDHLIVRMLNEYFAGDENVPLLIRQGLLRISGKRVLPHVAGRVVRSAIGSLAREFIAGNNPREALSVLKALQREGSDYSIDLLGEAVLSDREAGLYRAGYLDLLEFMGKRADDNSGSGVLAGAVPGFDISLKISSLYSQLNPVNWEGSRANAKEGLRPIFQKASQVGASVTIDMEHFYLKDLILSVFRDIVEEFDAGPAAGIAIQTYLKTAREDLLDLVGWARKHKRTVTVRLVKGAYWDHEVAVNRQKGWPIPVFLNKEDTDHSFEELTRLAMENCDCIRPAIATHNIRSVSHALAVAEALALPAQAFEFQMLYGMAEPLRRALEKMKYRVRVYTPVGEFLPGMAYLIRRLLENTSNESFLRRSFFDKTPFEELIRKPVPAGTRLSESRSNIFRNEPALDFSRAVNRESMNEAIRKTRDVFGAGYPMIIGGSALFTERRIVSVNPANTQEIIGRVSVADREVAERAVSEARKTWLIWRDVPAGERAEYLLRAADIIRKDRYTLAALEICEVGKTREDADGDVTEAIDYLQYYAREMLRLEQCLRLGDYPGEENEYCYRPKGVGVVIAPWNFPLAISAGMVSAGLVAGNCIIFKPSGLSPVTGYMLTDVFRRAGLPEGVLQFLPGPGSDVGEFLVSHPGTDFVAFTGSKDVGLKIVGLAATTVPGQRGVKKVIVEMGGKNAIIVDETADLDEAIKGAVESCFGYQGQKCSACSRLIVVGDIYDEFSRRFKEAVESIDIGPPQDPAFFMGPVIDKTAFERVDQFREIGIREGRPVLLRTAGEGGYFAGPAIFSDLPPDSPCLREEIFGPLVALLRAEDFDEALKMALDGLYALTGGVYSRSPRNISKARQAFRVGNLYINRKITGALVGRQPFGGSGMSGTGSKAGGPDYLLQFMDPRSISENTLRKGFAPDIRNSKLPPAKKDR